ncbi:MAG: M20/M25/M40 family metallo-hydrolase [Euryarchaeota archaeon]|nr:M20/M25/M40 family metallo-hydrolase [Euryarchaeota archaeon]
MSHDATAATPFTGWMEDEARAVALLEHLVSIPSVTGDTARVAATLVAWGEAQGLHAGTTPTGAPWLSTAEDPFHNATRPHILLFGHVDTVPGEVPVRRVTDEEEGEVLWGRGSVDAKGAAAVFATLVARWKDQDRPGTVTMIGSVDEEGDSETAHWAKDAFTAPPDAIVIGEPSGAHAVTLGYKGRLKVRVRVRRDVAHAGSPEESAADALVGLLARFREDLEERAEGTEGMFGVVTLTTKSLGSKSDGLTDEAIALLDIRVPPGHDDARVLGFFRRDPAHPTIEVLDSVPGHLAGKDSGLVRAFTAAIREEGVRPRHLRKTGTSDQCILAPAWPKAEVATYGPGDARFDHTPHERIRLVDVKAAVRVLDRALKATVASR